MDFFEHIKNIYHRLKNTTGGKNAAYIPELATVNPNLYAISIYTVNGDKFDIGDYNHEFAIESCSKLFTLSLAIERYGTGYLKTKIGEVISHKRFNSVCAIEESSVHTLNPFDNGGAMATTSLLYTPNKTKFIKEIVDNMSEYSGRKLKINNDVFKSEYYNSDHNRAIAYLLKSYGRFYGPVPECLEVYTKQCSVMINSQDGALMAATIANGGVNPKTGKRLIYKQGADYMVKQMIFNGLYDETPSWIKNVGFPAKSGVGGFLLISIPGVMGIAIASPPLNKYGNSVKGIKTAKAIANIINKK
jgi:glutaminase